MKVPSLKSKTVLITGCSSGIGRATADLLRDHGWTVFPSARKAEDLEMLAQAGFEPVELDVSRSASVQAAAKCVLEKTGGSLGALVNNAGFGQAGAMEDVSREALRQQFEVNVFGLQELSNAVIPAMREAGCGRIVNISSVLGFISTPLLGSYCASKYAVEALSDAQRVELRSSGIMVSLVEPGPITTEFRKNAADRAEETLQHESRFSGQYQHEIRRRKKAASGKKKPFALPPEAVADKILHALESPSPKRRYYVTTVTYLVALGRHILPVSLTDRMLAKKLPGNKAR